MNNSRKLDFIGIGAPRCGTTWISEILKQHHKIFIPDSYKELHFFNGRNLKMGEDWYHSFFDMAEENQVIGEFTPDYMGEEHSIKLIKAYNPNIKIIVCLRDPVERAISHFKYLSAYKDISNEFKIALDDPRYKLKQRGLYGEQLNQWLANFPEKNVHIIFFKDLKNRPKKVAEDLFDFLEIRVDVELNYSMGKVNASKGVWFKKIHYIIRYTKNKIIQYNTIYNIVKILKIDVLAKMINRINRRDKISNLIITREDVDYLSGFYKHDIEKLSKILNQEIRL